MNLLEKMLQSIKGKSVEQNSSIPTNNPVGNGSLNPLNKSEQDAIVKEEQNKLIKTLDNKLILDVRTGSSCDYHRILLPFTYCKPQPKVPVFMFNRIATHGLDFLYRLKDQGVKLIMDIDDYYQLDPSHYLYSSFLRSGMMQNLVANLKIADVVTTTTPLLASKLRHLNQNIVVIPNALPFDAGQFTMSTDKESKSPIVWCGGASHYNDLKEIQSVPFEEVLTFVGVDKNVEEWNKIKLDHPRVNYENALTLDKYMNAYDGHQFAIAPLVDSIFNACKSQLKVLEAGAKGLPIICSKVDPYYNPIDRDYVVYAENKSEWRIQMNKLLSYKDLREDRGMALAEHVRTEYQISASNEIRRQVIESFS